MPADALLLQIVQKYAADAVRMAQSKFHVDLDGSEESISRVEQILDQIHRATTVKPVTDEVIAVFSKTFGSYVGEVFRRHHGGEWFMMEVDGGQYPGIKDEGRDFTFWPWGKVCNRIRDGRGESVAAYYTVSVKVHGA